MSSPCIQRGVTKVAIESNILGTKPTPSTAHDGSPLRAPLCATPSLPSGAHTPRTLYINLVILTHSIPPPPRTPQRDYSIPFALFDAKGKQVEPTGVALTELQTLTLSVTPTGSQLPAQGVTCALKDPNRPLLGFSVNFSATAVNQDYNVSISHPSPRALDVSGCLPGVTVTPVLYMLAVQEFTSKEEVFLPDGAEVDADCGKR